MMLICQSYKVFVLSTFCHIHLTSIQLKRPSQRSNTGSIAMMTIIEGHMVMESYGICMRP